MNETSRLEPQAIIAQAEEMIRNLDESSSRLQIARSAMIAFINDDSSSTRGINLLKQKQRDLIRIVDALILANMLDVSDCKRLIALVSEVDGNINGQRILWLLNEVERNIAHYEERLQRARYLLHSPIAYPSQSPPTYQNAEFLIAQYVNLLDAQNELRDYLLSRIDLYNEIEFQSKSLFKGGDELRDEAARGLKMIIQAATGLPLSYVHPSLFEWRRNIRTKKEDSNHVKIDVAVATLNSLREQGVAFPRDWSEEDKINFAKRYLAEVQRLQGFMNENFPETDFGNDYSALLDFQQAEQIAWFFLADPQLAFYLDFDQRVELMGIMSTTNMHGPVEAFFIREGFTDDSGGIFSLGEAGDLARHASNAYSSAEQGMTTIDWVTSLFAMGGLEGGMRIAGLPRIIRPSAKPKTGQQPPNHGANELPKSKAKEQQYRIHRNVKESKIARESSNFGEHVKRAKRVETRDRVLENIEKSRKAREASNFREHVKREKQAETRDRVLENIEKSRKARESSNFREHVNRTSVVPESTVRHADLGDFTINPKTGEPSKMTGGGHGQANIDFLRENGFEVNINRTFSNGVRVGNVPEHKTKSKRTGNNQSWFPENWTANDIRRAGEHIASQPEFANMPDGYIIWGTFRGVRVGVIKTNGKPGTIFPDANWQPE